MRIRSNLTYVLKIKSEFIKPGINYIKDLNVISHPSFKARIDNKQIELLDSKNISNNQIRDEEIKGFDFKNKKVADLIKDIREIYDLKLLEEIEKNDTRSSIKQACITQLENIKNQNVNN